MSIKTLFKKFIMKKEQQLTYTYKGKIVDDKELWQALYGYIKRNNLFELLT